jgi:1-aminocyclopropane-1-carboxylate deaminase
MDTISGQPLVQRLPLEWGGVDKDYSVDVLRLDLIHPIISGNKYFKLKYNLQHALEKGYKSVLTFGGAYSNHLHATAAAAKEFNLSSVGLVRGHHAEHQLTETLRDCKELGMELKFLSREAYVQKEDPEFLQQLAAEYPNTFIIPEGGANQQGREGASEISDLIPPGYTHICVSIGTGTTFIGLRNTLPTSQILLGFVPMKGGTYLHSTIPSYLYPGKDVNWQLLDHYHFGGFAKSTADLVSFINTFYTHTSIPLDVVYTSKMFYGIRDLIQNSFIPASAKILAIHTGGLQGNRSIRHKLIY